MKSIVHICFFISQLKAHPYCTSNYQSTSTLISSSKYPSACRYWQNPLCVGFTVSSDCLQSAFVRSLLSFSFDVPEVWSRFVEIHNHCLHLSFILSLYWLSEYQPGSFFCLIPMKQFFAASITLATAFKLSISRILNMFIKLLRTFTRKFEILAKPLPWLLHKLHTHNSSKNTTVFPNKFASDLHHICPWIEHVSNKIPNCVNDNTTNRGTIIK